MTEVSNISAAAKMTQTNSVKPNGSHHAVLAGFLGWTLDAFDFFVVVFLFDTLARWGALLNRGPEGETDR